MVEEQRVAEIAKRIWYEFDGSYAYWDFIESLDKHNTYIGPMAKKVKKVLEAMLFNNYKHNIETEIQTLYTPQFLEYGQADTDAINAKYVYSSYYTSRNEVDPFAEQRRRDAYADRKKYIEENNIRVQATIDSEIIRIYDERKSNLIERVKLENPLNKCVFQETHEMNKDSIPNWLVEKYLVTFTYVNSVDKEYSWLGYSEESVRQANISDTLSMRLTGKTIQYEAEVERFAALKRKWIQGVIDAEISKAEAEEASEDDFVDPYVIMAEATINYWKSTLTQPFAKSPPIPLCNIPSPGTYIPIYYGSKTKLANDLRKAWNSGKSFKKPGTINIATRTVATAVAKAHAKHLAQLKFIYVGQLYVGTVTIPMIGISLASF